MTEIRPLSAADAPRLTELLAQLGYPGGLDAVTNRLAIVLNSTTQQVLVAVPADDSRIDGYIGVERRLALEYDERLEIIALVVDSAARRSGLGRALVNAAEQWALQHDLHIVGKVVDELKNDSRQRVDNVTAAGTEQDAARPLAFLFATTRHSAHRVREAHRSSERTASTRIPVS